MATFDVFIAATCRDEELCRTRRLLCDEYERLFLRGIFTFAFTNTSMGDTQSMKDLSSSISTFEFCLTSRIFPSPKIRLVSILFRTQIHLQEGLLLNSFST